VAEHITQEEGPDRSGETRASDRSRETRASGAGRFGDASGASVPRIGPRFDQHPPFGQHPRFGQPSWSRLRHPLGPKPKAQLDEEFSELYRTHLRDVYSYAYYRVGNHHDAEDLTEQTFLQAYRHFERAQRESRGRPLRPWLIRIAHNLAANLYRDRSRRPSSPIEDTDALSDLHTTEDLVENRSELSRVLAGVRRLPDDRREALIMRFALDMDNREIARALGRSDGATKVLIHRAIKQLEGLVADAPDEGGEGRGGGRGDKAKRVPGDDEMREVS
jgi:RNA polymerase sigma-70 factor (ECF subfamily)